MNLEKRPKWDAGVAVNKGKQSTLLIEKYLEEIQGRFQPDEIPQHNSNVIELELRRSGQKENLVDQKAKTLGQAEAISVLHSQVIGIRGIVKSSSPSAEILKSFGVGEKLYETKSSVMSAAKVAISGYSANPEWCNKNAGILEEDIVQINELLNILNESDNLQETSKFVRKSKTMDKNSLQRAVEDMVTRISAIGVHIFRMKNPEIANLFAGLIPSTAKSETTTNTETQA